MQTTAQNISAKSRLLRTMFAGMLSFAILLSCFHGSACEAEIRGTFPGTVVSEQSQPTQQPVAQHQMVDHCLSHLIGDLSHPARAAVAQSVMVKLSWYDEAERPTTAFDSPFEPPRA
jgi:hypothetical protein